MPTFNPFYFGTIRFYAVLPFWPIFVFGQSYYFLTGHCQAGESFQVFSCDENSKCLGKLNINLLLAQFARVCMKLDSNIPGKYPPAAKSATFSSRNHV